MKEGLTPGARHEYLDSIENASGGADPVAIGVRDAAQRLIHELGRAAAGAPLGAVAAARGLSAAADVAMQAAVDRARAAGHSWREIGDVLQTTRQAAFQRFGHPVDPRTGTPVIPDTLPGAADRATAIVGCMIEGRWEDARAGFGERMREAVDAGRLSRGWAQTIAMIGAYERTGEPLAYQIEDATVVDVPLHFEAGDRTGRVAFARDGRVIGLFLRKLETR